MFIVGDVQIVWTRGKVGGLTEVEVDKAGEGNPKINVPLLRHSWKLVNITNPLCLTGLECETRFQDLRVIFKPMPKQRQQSQSEYSCFKALFWFKCTAQTWSVLASIWEHSWPKVALEITLQFQMILHPQTTALITSISVVHPSPTIMR